MKNKAVYFWLGDLINGGVHVQCQLCEDEFNILDTDTSVTKHECPHCKEILDYPEGASW